MGGWKLWNTTNKLYHDSRTKQIRFQQWTVQHHGSHRFHEHIAFWTRFRHKSVQLSVPFRRLQESLNDAGTYMKTMPTNNANQYSLRGQARAPFHCSNSSCCAVGYVMWLAFHLKKRRTTDRLKVWQRKKPDDNSIQFFCLFYKTTTSSAPTFNPYCLDGSSLSRLRARDRLGRVHEIWTS